MKAFTIGVIYITVILSGCGKNGREITPQNCDDNRGTATVPDNKRIDTHNKKQLSLHHKKAVAKNYHVKTGSKIELPIEDRNSEMEMDNSSAPGHWNGVYHDYQSNTLKISNFNLNDKTFHFRLDLVTQHECIGEIEGKAKVINETPQAHYIQDPLLGNCEITFEFNRHRSIQIKKLYCMDANGNQCIFEGLYTK